MNSSWKVISATLALLMTALVPPPQLKAGEVPVKFRPEVAKANAEAVLKMQGTHPGPDPSPGSEAGGRTPGQELAIVEALSRNSDVGYTEPNYIAYATDTDANDVIIRVYDRDGNMICR